MYDLPPQHLETHYEYVVANGLQTAAKGDVFDQFEFSMTELASQIKGYFPKGLKWGDIPKIFSYALQMVDRISDAHSRKITALYIVDKVIDITDTPFLPDAATDPIFKKIAHSLISHYFNQQSSQDHGKKNSAHRPQKSEDAIPTDETLMLFASRLNAIFADGFQPADFTMIVALSHDFTNQFPGLNVGQKRAAVTKIVNHMIDLSDTPLFPDCLTDPLMKKVVPSIVNFLVN